MATMTPAELKMARAKTSLILMHPFYATLAMNMEWVQVEPDHPQIKTMATNGERYYWNPKFVDTMTLDETKFVICHEIMHVVWTHCFRRGARDPYNWNVATDYVINDMLIKEGIGVMPKEGLNNPQLVQAGKEQAEIVYDLLPPPPPPNKQYYVGDGSGKPGPLDQLQDPGGSKADRSAQQNLVKVRVAQAANAAKMCGKMSANLERLVSGLLKPKVDWKDVLRRFVSVRAKIDASYAKPKRRFIGDDLYLPSLVGERLGTMVVAVDCSGSIGQRELNEFATEIYAIHEDCRPAAIDVLYFDSEISHHDHYEADDTPKIVGHGGGGTDFAPIFEYVDKHGIEPACLVVLTDGFCSSYGNAPSFPVLWVTTGQGGMPFGEIVEMKSGD